MIIIDCTQCRLLAGLCQMNCWEMPVVPKYIWTWRTIEPNSSCPLNQPMSCTTMDISWETRPQVSSRPHRPHRSRTTRIWQSETLAHEIMNRPRIFKYDCQTDLGEDIHKILSLIVLFLEVSKIKVDCESKSDAHNRQYKKLRENVSSTIEAIP